MNATYYIESWSVNDTTWLYYYCVIACTWNIMVAMEISVILGNVSMLMLGLIGAILVCLEWPISILYATNSISILEHKEFTMLLCYNCVSKTKCCKFAHVAMCNINAP